MSDPRRNTLYSTDLLALAVELGAYPYKSDATLQGEARSRTCGSVIALSADTAFDNLGLRVSACAVGQAAAAIFARHVADRNLQDLNTVLDQMDDWLGQGGARPEWPDIELLAPARNFPGRHGAIMLPWKAALDALSKGRDEG